MSTAEDNTEYSKYEAFLDGWRIVRKIGQGSIGKVYEISSSSDPAERAALKIIRLPDGPEDVKRALSSGVRQEDLPQYYSRLMQTFMNEYEFMEKLRGSEHIVAYDSHVIIPHEDGIGGDILIRMELLRPLIDHVLDDEPDEEDVLRMGLDISEALMACEEADMLHRDIKPDNIFVSEEGSYKLGDFGVARIIEETEMNLSHKGTLAYMAPEVFRGEEYGMAADIYSLGLVMYKYLNNGRLPFMPGFPEKVVYEDSEKAFSRRVRKEAIPAPENGSPELQEVVLKACATEVNDRYKTASELHEALEQVNSDVQADREKAVRRARRYDKRSRRRITAAVILMILAAAAASAWALIPKEVTDIKGPEQGEEIYIGESISPEYEIEPEWFKDEKISFDSSDEKVFTVDEEGRISAGEVGEADLELSARGYSESIRICVVPKVTEIGGVEPELSITEGETAQLEPVLSPEKFRKEPVSFETSDSEVAAVTDEGLIVAITPGTATVKLSAGGCNKEVKVTVESKPVPVYYDTDKSVKGSKSKKTSKTGSKSSKKSGKSNSGSKSGGKGVIDDIDDEYFD